MEELLQRGVDQVIVRDELEQVLASGRKLRIKFGVDPTRPDIHLGHAVALRKLRQFQDLGHTVIFLIGDYTTKIGDPSGRNQTRPILSDEEITVNAQTYLDQVGVILDVPKLEIRRNSEWWQQQSFGDLLKLAAQFSVAQLTEREDFANRLAKGQELSLHELLYPVMQAYDSVALEADVEFGGTDQLFNLLAGRSLQKKLGQSPQAVVVADLLVGLDGTNKMSKSLGNYVGLVDSAVDMYGKLMSLPDHLIAPYYRLCTDVPLPVIDELVKTLAAGANPRDSKASLAREIVRLYHGDKAALAAEAAWNHQFREGGQPEVIEAVQLTKAPATLVELLVQIGLAESKNEARRLIEQGGVRIDDVVQTLASEPVFRTGQIIQAGKRRYRRLKVG